MNGPDDVMCDVIGCDAWWRDIKTRSGPHLWSCHVKIKHRQNSWSTTNTVSHHPTLTPQTSSPPIFAARGPQPEQSVMGTFPGPLHQAELSLCCTRLFSVFLPLTPLPTELEMMIFKLRRRLCSCHKLNINWWKWFYIYLMEIIF